MFDVPKDVSIVQRSALADNWFPCPFGVIERVKTIDDWAAGKLTDSKPQKLSSEWALTNAERFLQDYEATILTHCTKKWKLLTKTEFGSRGDALTANFQFDATNPPLADSKVKDPNVVKMNQEYNAALLYYLREVVDLRLAERISNWKILSDDPNELSWYNAQIVIKRHLTSPRGMDLVCDLVCLKRRDGEPLLDWCQSNAALCKEMKEDFQIVIPEPTLLEWLNGQISPAEKRLIVTRHFLTPQMKGFVVSNRHTYNLR